MKKIEKITIKHIPDYDVDLSWLGTFSDTAGKFAIEHTQGNTRNSYKYFNADNVENMKQAQQNYNHIMKYDSGDLYAIGIKAEADIRTSDDGKNWLINHISSGGLWGIEMGYPNDREDIKEIEQEQLADLKDVLLQLGFTEDEIKSAPIEIADR